MNEWINRNDVLNLCMSYCPDDDGSCSHAKEDLRCLLDDIEALPTIEIVRCEDCQFSCTPEWDSDEVFCIKYDNWFKINGYCHLGETKRIRWIG